MKPERQSPPVSSNPSEERRGLSARLRTWIPIHLAASRTGRQAGMVVGGNVVNKALTFLIQSALGRAMEKPVFAVFNLTAMMLEVAVELADLGLNVNLVRNYSRHAESNRPAALSVVQLVLRIKVLWVLFLTTALYLLVPRFASLLGNPDELTGPFRFAAVGLAAPVMVYFALAHLQAVRWFGRYILVNVLERAGLLAVMAILALTGCLTLGHALAAWILFPFLAAALGLALAPHDYLRIRRIEPGVAGEIFHFGKWALASSLLTLTLWRLDVFMLAALSTREKLADYMFAVRLIALFQVITQGLNTALLPRVGRMGSISECHDYLKMIGKAMPLIVLVAGALCLLAVPLVVIPFGEKARAAVPIFRILLVSESLMVFAVPVSLVLYRLNRVDLICVTNTVLLVVCAGANWVLIPRLAGMGAATAYFLVRLAATVSTLILVSYALRRQAALGQLSD